jgi:hypothetical protein
MAALVRRILTDGTEPLLEVIVVTHSMGRMRLVFEDRTVTVCNPFALKLLENVLAPGGLPPQIERITITPDGTAVTWAPTKGTP